MKQFITIKYIISVFLIIILFQSCAEESNTEATIELIKKVETGLFSGVYVEGDSTWSIEERMKHYGIPGASIAVIHNGKIVWTKGFGVMDKESKSPVTEKTLFQVSTMGMRVTAFGALSLVEQKKASLDENVNNYLNSWKVPENDFTKEKKVTIKNLLNHSAGMNVHAFRGYSTDLPVPTLLEVLNGTSPANSIPIIVDKVPEESLWISAGGYSIIQQMMMDIEGKKFPEIMNELVFQPLGMTNSTFNQTLTTDQLKMAATGYLRDGSMVKGKRHTYPELASNGLWTNAEDLAKFVINIQQTLKGNSNKGLSKDMTALMLTPFEMYNYSLGFLTYKKKDEFYFEHHGWSTGFYGRMTAHRDKGYGVVVLTNSTHSGFVFEVFRSVANAYEWDSYVVKYKKKDVQPFLNGNFEKALDTYGNLKKQDPNNSIILENNLNSLGYSFLSKDLINAAHDVLKVNTILYPESANVYDSYGEICKTMGKMKLAILNYTKSLELDPQNDNAKNMLKELRKK